MKSLSELYGVFLEALALAACAVLFLMMLMICGDVLLRNVELLASVRGLPSANELSEYMLYLITMLAAPWLLRQGQHIRVDIFLRALPARSGWYCEWVADIAAFAGCSVMIRYGALAAYASYTSGTLTMKTLVMPEWWMLLPLPLAFLLLALEVILRMRRLWLGERAPRDDAVSAS